jgi:hypothetical protein
MKILKYIITEKVVPIIFSSEMQHDSVLQTGVSAGFLIVKYDNVCNKFSANCFGYSSSLKLESVAGDKSVIEKYLNNDFI